MTTQDHSFPEVADNSSGILQGWDTVFAIRYEHVNSAIVRAGTSPEDFDQTITDDALRKIVPDETFGDSATIVGDFGDWEVTPGGAGHLIFMKLPVPTVTLTRPGHDDAVRTDVEYVVSVQLEAVERKGVKGFGGGQLFDFKVLGPQSPSNPTVTVQSCTYEGWETDGFVHVFLFAAMADWLNEHISKFNQVFATVNLNAKADHDRFDWLMPTTTSYAVNDTGTLESGIFAVMCMTKDRSKPRNQQVVAEVLPDGEKASFLISRERFLSQMLSGGMGTMFTGPIKPDDDKQWPDDYFTLVDDDTMLTNTHDLYIENLDVGKEGEPEYVRAEIGANNLTAKLEETYLNVHMRDLKHPYYSVLGKWYLNVHHTITSYNMARLNPDQVFDLVPVHSKLGEDTAEHEAIATKTEWAKVVTWAEIFIGLMALAFPLARAGWLRYVGGAAEEVEGGAAAIATVEVEGPIIEEEVQNLEQEGAQGALEMIRRGLTSLRTFLVGSFQSWRGRLIWSMSALLTTDQILAAIADDHAVEKLPEYREFAATVMAPIQWPDAEDFEVSEVQFNGSFQTFGDPKFPG